MTGIISLDSHDAAIESNKQKLISKVNNYIIESEKFINQDKKDKILNLTNNIFNHLRSPIKKNFLDDLAKGIINQFKKEKLQAFFNCVLASVTAVEELPYFLKFIDFWHDQGFEIKANFLLVRWENLVEVEHLDFPERNKQFIRELDALNALISGHVVESKIIPINWVHSKEEDLELTDEICHFFDHILEVFQMVNYQDKLDNVLKRDINWIVHFYERQDSLKALGKKQALLDLAIRRAIGHYVEKQWVSQQEHDLYLLITSELNKRFLDCYNSSTPITNIKVG